MPVAAFPNVLAGQSLTAALLTSPEITAWKVADTSRASVATLSADPDLVIPLVANAVYRFEAFLVFNGGTLASSDFQVQVNAPANASTFWWSAKGKDNNTLAPVLGSAQTSGNAAFGTSGTGSQREAEIKGFVATFTAGNLSLFWAQATSNSTATTLKAGSHFLAKRIA